MSAWGAAGLLAGVGVGGGLCLLVWAMVAREPTPARPPRLRLDGRRVAVAATAGVATLAATWWIVAAAAMAALAWWYQSIIATAVSGRARIARLEAIATWTESLRDSVAGASGLEQAILTTAPKAGASIRPHLLRLADQLRGRMELERALRGLADELGDSTGDLVVASLMMSASLRAAGLRDVLAALATSAREEVEMRRKVEAERRTLRNGVLIMVAVNLATVAMLKLTSPALMAAYDGPLGQLMLAIVAVIYALGFWWLAQLSRRKPLGRIFSARGSA